jgi:hypothetical protein
MIGINIRTMLEGVGGWFFELLGFQYQTTDFVLANEFWDQSRKVIFCTSLYCHAVDVEVAKNREKVTTK